MAVNELESILTGKVDYCVHSSEELREAQMVNNNNNNKKAYGSSRVRKPLL